MSDDTADATDVRYFVESGTAHVNDETYNITSGNVSIDTDTTLRNHAAEAAEDHLQTEYTGSFTFTFETQTVVCPACNSVVDVPNSAVLGAFTRDPYPCVECGYPLL